MRVAIVALFLAIIGILTPKPSLAAPCAGFTDVEATNPFCTSIEWIKNRGITYGCAATLYCPDQYVRRDQMAAFLARLGRSHSPLMIVDANGKVVGPAASPFTGPPPAGYVLYRGQSASIMMRVYANENSFDLANLGQDHAVYFTTTDCTGTPYFSVNAYGYSEVLPSRWANIDGDIWIFTLNTSSPPAPVPVACTATECTVSGRNAAGLCLYPWVISPLTLTYPGIAVENFSASFTLPFRLD